MKKKTVVVAEDVAQTRAVLRTILRSANCEILREISDGPKVIPTIQQLRPDIVILDINLPGKDGFDILKEMRAQKMKHCVLLMSSDSDSPMIKRAQESGAQGYIIKPFNAKSIINALNKTAHHIFDGKPLTASIIDDDANTRSLTKEMLKTFSCDTIYESDDGIEAGEHLSKMEAKPDFTFIDIELKKGDGLSLLKQLSDRHVNTFTVVISAHGTVENVKNALSAGANGFIVKPVTPDKLQQVFEKYEEAINKPVGT